MKHCRSHTALSRIHQAFAAEQYEQSLSLSRSLKRELLDSEEACDPLELGWARFYEFKSLYELGKYRQAYDLLERPEPRTYAVPQKNAAYMFSVGSELAMHLGLAQEVVCWGERCLEARLDAGDRIGAVQCANTVCVLLGRMERDDLNTRFAHYLIEIGKETGAERPLIRGYRFLAANIALSSDPLLMVEAAAGVGALTAIHDDRFSGEALEALGAIVHAPWYVHQMNAADRAAHEGFDEIAARLRRAARRDL